MNESSSHLVQFFKSVRGRALSSSSRTVDRQHHLVYSWMMDVIDWISSRGTVIRV